MEKQQLLAKLNVFLLKAAEDIHDEYKSPKNHLTEKLNLAIASGQTLSDELQEAREYHSELRKEAEKRRQTIKNKTIRVGANVETTHGQTFETGLVIYQIRKAVGGLINQK